MNSRNIITAKRAKEEGKVSTLFVRIKSDEEGVTQKMVEEIGGFIPFGRARDLEKWSVWIRRNQVEFVSLQSNSEERIHPDAAFNEETNGIILPITIQQKIKVQPIGHLMEIKNNDRIHCLLQAGKKEQFEKWISRSIFIQNST